MLNGTMWRAAASHGGGGPKPGPCGIKLNDSSNTKYIIQYAKTIIKHGL